MPGTDVVMAKLAGRLLGMDDHLARALGEPLKHHHSIPPGPSRHPGQPAIWLEGSTTDTPDVPRDSPGASASPSQFPTSIERPREAGWLRLIDRSMRKGDADFGRWSLPDR
jgi:hypothetical protein